MEKKKLSYYMVIQLKQMRNIKKESAKLLYGLISSLINEEGYCLQVVMSI